MLKRTFKPPWVKSRKWPSLQVFKYKNKCLKVIMKFNVIMKDNILWNKMVFMVKMHEMVYIELAKTHEVHV